MNGVENKFLRLPHDELESRARQLGALHNDICYRNDSRLHIPRSSLFPPRRVDPWQKPSPGDALADPALQLGFVGAAPLMFVGLWPSTRFDTEEVIRFYRLLHKHGFRNAHLTDAVKVVGGRPRHQAVERAVFHRELDIVKPYGVVVVRNAEEIVSRYIDRHPGWNGMAPTMITVRHWRQLADDGFSSDWEEHDLGAVEQFLCRWASENLELGEDGFYRRRLVSMPTT